MQNMQKYFGFTVKVSEYLEPADYRLLRERLIDIMESQGVDSTNYRIYLHQLAFAATSSKFGIGGGLMGRVNQVYLRFSINLRQRNNREIQFMNHMFKLPLDDYINPYYTLHEIGYTIKTDFFSSRQWFQNLIITLVDIRTREAHKKIKVSVSVEPTDRFREQLKNEMLSHAYTKIDLDFKRGIEFTRQTKLFLFQNVEVPMSTEANAKNSGSPKNVFNIDKLGALNVDSPNSTVNGQINVLNDPTLLEHVVKDLKILLSDACSNRTSIAPDKDIAVIEGVVAEAPKNPQALSRLRTIGKWALDRAEQIGLSLLAEVLKGKLGI